MPFGQQKRRAFLARSALAGGAILSGVGSTAAATQLTVDRDDPEAYDSIQQAVHEAPDGAVITVTSGTYSGGVGIPASKELTIRGDPGDDSPGAGPDAPVLDGERDSGAAFYMESSESAPPLTIEGFVIRNYGTDLFTPGEPNDDWGAGISVGYRSNVTIRDVSMDHIAGSGVGAGSGGNGTSTNWLVERCTFDSIAHTAIRLSSVQESRIVDNEVTATDAVPDAEGQWWEKHTPAGYPVHGIQIAASASDGNESVTREITIEDNYLEARFDSTAINLFSHDYSGSQTLVEDVFIRNNTVDLTDIGNPLHPSEKHGIKLGVNAGPDIRPAAMRDVLITGNTVRNATHAYKFNGMSPFEDDPDATGGLKRVECRDNVAIDSAAGCIPLTLREGDAAEFTIESNRFVDCKLGVVLWSGGRSLSSLTIRNNTYEQAGEDEASDTVFGIEPVAFGADLTDVTISNEEIRNHQIGLASFALEGARLTGVTVEDSVLSGNETGVLSRAYDEQSTVEQTIRETTIEANQVGVLTTDKTDASNMHVHRCDFRGHAEFAAENRSGIGVLDATCNYWGDPTGPTHDSNRPGRGDAVSDGVDYDPLLSQSYEKVPEEACHPGAGNPAEHAGSSGRKGNGPGKRGQDKA